MSVRLLGSSARTSNPLTNPEATLFLRPRQIFFGGVETGQAQPFCGRVDQAGPNHRRIRIVDVALGRADRDGVIERLTGERLARRQDRRSPRIIPAQFTEPDRGLFALTKEAHQFDFHVRKLAAEIRRRTELDRAAPKRARHVLQGLEPREIVFDADSPPGRLSPSVRIDMHQTLAGIDSRDILARDGDLRLNTIDFGIPCCPQTGDRIRIDGRDVSALGKRQGISSDAAAEIKHRSLKAVRFVAGDCFGSRLFEFPGGRATSLRARENLTCPCGAQLA